MADVPGAALRNHPAGRTRCWGKPSLTAESAGRRLRHFAASRPPGPLVVELELGDAGTRMDARKLRRVIEERVVLDAGGADIENYGEAGRDVKGAARRLLTTRGMIVA